jgi:hypothetical protein
VSETVEADPVRWSLERPGGSVDLSEEAVSAFSNVETSSVFNLSILDYEESDGSNGQDVFYMRVGVLCEASSGFIEDAHLKFQEDYAPSYVNWKEKLYEAKSENFSVIDCLDLLAGEEKAVMTLRGLDQPSRASLKDAAVDWALCSPKNYTHVMSAMLELVYFSGTTYKKVIQSIEFRVYPDNDNTPETAEEIQNGTYTRKCVGGYDHSDFYKIYRAEGQNINISVDHSFSPGYYNLYLFDPSMDQKAIDQSNEADKALSLMADSSGFWLIEIRSLYYDSSLFYSLEVL